MKIETSFEFFKSKCESRQVKGGTTFFFPTCLLMLITYFEFGNLISGYKIMNDT